MKNGPSNSHYNIREKRKEKMIKEAEQKWINPREYFINSFLNHTPLNTCPECGHDITYSTEDEDEAYCTKCGLVVMASIEYVAGIHINLPYGRRP